jgi:hypothetical protein
VETNKVIITGRENRVKSLYGKQIVRTISRGFYHQALKEGLHFLGRDD